MSHPGERDSLAMAADELAAIGHRLTQLSGMLRARAGQAHPPPPSAPVTPPPPASPTNTTPPPPPGPPPWHRDFAGTTPPRSGLGQKWTASRLLAWAGGAVTLLGVVLLFVLAAQRGWLSPASRLIGGAGLGVALVGAAYWAHRKPGGKAGGYALAATGFAALFLDAVAATALYEYLPRLAGLGAGLLAAVGGLLLADRWRAQPLAIGAVLGCAVCSPLITQRPSALLVAFLVLLQLAAAPVQLRHGWRGLTAAAAIPTVLAALLADLWALGLPHPESTVAAVIAVALLGVVLAAITAAVRPDEPITSIGVLVASPAPALLAAPLLGRTAAGSLAAGVAIMLLALWASGRFIPAFRRLLPSPFVATAGGAGTIAGVQATTTFVDPAAWATALLCEALLLTLAAYRLRSNGALIGASCYVAAGFIAALSHEIPPTVLLGWSTGEGATTVLVGALLSMAALSIPLAASRIGGVRLGVWPLWTLAGFSLLYGTSSATMGVVLLVRADRTGFLAAHVLITLSWVLLAIVLLLRGIRLARLRMAGMVLLPVALAKLFLFDLAALDGFARVVAFLCAGLVLLAAGVRYARLVGRGTSES